MGYIRNNSEYSISGSPLSTKQVVTPDNSILDNYSTASPSSSPEGNIQRLVNICGYEGIQYNGQRTFGPPSHWSTNIPTPTKECEVFVGRLPRDAFEDELLPILLKIGHLYTLRLMMAIDGGNRGYGFARYATVEESDRAVSKLNGVLIRPGHRLGVTKAINKNFLLIRNLPTSTFPGEIIEHICASTPGVKEVKLTRSNRCAKRYGLIEFHEHRDAALARRHLFPAGLTQWDIHLKIGWADHETKLPGMCDVGVWDEQHGLRMWLEGSNDPTTPPRPVLKKSI